MFSKKLPVIVTLVVDSIIYAIALACGGVSFTWQAVSFCAAIVAAGCVAIIRDKQPVTIRFVLCFVAVVVCGPAFRSGLMNFVAEGLQISHPFLMFLPALVISGACAPLMSGVSFSDSTKDDALVTILLIVAALVTILRSLFLGSIELLPEEGYYWNYATHLAAGYIDHPPMVALIIRLGTALLGINEYGVRIVASICSILTVLALGLLHRKIFGSRGWLLTVSLAALSPYLIGTGLIVSPDSALALFWAMAIYFLFESLVEQKKQSWFFAGVAIGLGMISKYTIVLLGLPIAMFMAFDTTSHNLWKRKEPYLAGLISVLIFSPVIWWNITHHFASFAFQSTRRVASTHHFYTPQLLLDMIILLMPATLVAGVLGVISVTQPRVKWFAVAFTGIPTAVFCYFSISHETKLNWTGPGLLLLIPFAAYWLSNISEPTNRLTKILQKSFVPSSIAILCLLSITFQYVGYGLPGIGYGQSLHRILGSQAMAKAVIDEAQTLKVVTNQSPVIVGMDKHFIAANFSFYAQKIFLGQSPYEVGSRNIIGDDALMWDFWSPPQHYIGRSMILVAKTESDLSDTRIKDFFESIDPVKPLEVFTRGKKTKTYFIRVVRGYKGITSESEKAKALLESKDIAGEDAGVKKELSVPGTIAAPIGTEPQLPIVTPIPVASVIPTATVVPTVTPTIGATTTPEIEPSMEPTIAGTPLSSFRYGG